MGLYTCRGDSRSGALILMEWRMKNMTVDEARLLLKSLKEVFTIARIVDPETHEVWDWDDAGAFASTNVCYQAWNRENPCVNCHTKRTCQKRINTDKYEVLSGDVYHVTSKPLMVGDRLFALEVVTKLDDVNRRETLFHAQERNMEIINILASEYTSVYYIDLVSGVLDPYTMNEELESEFGQIFRSGIQYAEAFKMYVSTLVYGEDREKMLRAGSVENIIDELRDKKTFITTYRSDNGGDPHYCEMKFVKVGDANDEPTAVALGFADKNDEIRARMKLEIEQRRNSEIIEILASEYTSVYYIDLTTDELTPYTMNEETESEFGQIFRSGINYSDAFRMYVGTLVYGEDRGQMLNSGSVANIAAELTNKKTFITTYRSDNGGDPHYCEMKFVKVGDAYGEPREVALGFADKNDEIRAELARKAEADRNNEIIEILASEYTSVYYIDLTTDELTPYTMNEETENQFGVLFKNMTYSDAFRMYVDTLILPEDKPMMLKAGSLGNIMKELRHKKTFLTTYRTDNNGDPHYCEMKFVKVGTEDGAPKAVALGFADKDDELRKRIEQDTVRKRNTEIIEILASEYSSVYYIDLTTDELDPYTMNAETESEFGQIFRSGIKYSEAFRLYVNTLVYPEDKSMMLKAGSIYNILVELHDKKTFITTYRSDNNGDPHYCEMKFVKVGDDDNPQAVALGFSDKNDQIRAELQEKQEREKNFEIIDILASEYSSVYYIDLNSDGVTPYSMNDKTREFFEDVFSTGIKYSEAFRLYVENAVAPESREMMLHAGAIDNIRSRLRGQKTFITTYLNDRNEYSEMKFVKVGDEFDNPQAVALGFSVVDASYRRELEIKQREEFINGLADDYEAVFHVTPENVIEGIRITNDYSRRNPSLEQRMAFGDYVEKVAANIVPEDRQAFIEALSPANIDREFGSTDAFFHNYRISKNGTITYYQLKVIHTGEWPADRNFLIGVHNMDELTRAQVAQEEILEDARNEAESANRAKSTFLFNMSPDIRTPMNAIIGFNNMALKHIDEPERLRDCLNKVNLSSQHLLSIINDVLDMARIESGKVNIQEERVIITDAATTLSDIVAQSVKDKNLTFLTDFSGVTHNCVFADELRVNRVLMNVINNAIKYTHDGGSVHYTIVETPCDDPDYAAYQFTIRDTGIGMSPEFLAHIYEAFTREASSTVSGIQGTGLGMAITRELVELMQGTIHIDSEVGVGTTVVICFRFRIADERYVEQENSMLDTEALRGKRILLVEDNELNREIAGDIMAEMGIIVDEAENGSVAVEKCSAIMNARADRQYDVILMDVQMPVMDGYEATRQIRSLGSRYARSVPIIALTANAFAEDKKNALDAGMDGHLAKPIDVKALVKTLSNVLTW